MDKKYEGWYFYNGGLSKVSKYFNILVESGLYGLLREEEFRQINLDRLPVKKVREEELAQPIKVNGAISTLVVPGGATIVAAVMAFGFENFYYIYIPIYITIYIALMGKLSLKIL